MAVDDVRFQARRELEAAGLTVEVAAYVAEARPPGGWDSLVIKDYLRAELAELHTEMAQMRQELHTEMAQMRQELHGEVGSLRSEFKDAMTKQMRWFVGALLVSQGVVVAAIAEIVGS